MPMTKAEAVCACNNILQLVEDLDELLSEKGREDYAGSINKKMTDMRQFILSQWRGERITDKMDAAIRNTWSGLRKWDHEDAYNTELFDGLNDTILELQENAPAPSSEGDEEPRDVRTSEKKQKGREMTDDEMPAVPADAVPDRVLAPRPQTPSVPSVDRGSRAPEPKSQATSATFTSPNGSGLIDRELVAKAREKALGLVRRQVEEKSIRIVETNVIAHGDLAHLLNQTSSDRTKQLILAAFYAGKMTGIQALAQDLIE